MPRIRRSSPHTLSLFDALMNRARSWHYGYELTQLTELKSGTLYPILMRLCDRGLLESKWQDSPEPGRPPRHMYRLTTTGIAHVRAELSRDESVPQRRRLKPSAA